MVASPLALERHLLALSGNAPVETRAGSGEREELLLTWPGRLISEFLFTVRTPIGRLLRDNQRVLDLQRLVLAFLLALVMVLSMHVAGRILAPVLAFTAAVRRFMRRDFSARLHLERTDEFGRLAASFNHMAAGVEEGSRLRRFVSDSVRRAASDARLEADAQKGTAMRTIVLFAGPAGFKHQVASRSPEDLVAELNAHLREMSGLIRAAGGEIDKFIGEKILAVFPPDRLGGEEAACRAALDAARAMRQAARGARRLGEAPLGVGLVAGEVLAGILGTPEVRLEFTVIGDTVNLASRLGDLAQGRPGGAILVDGEMAALARRASPHHILTRMDVTSVKGKRRTIEVFALEEDPTSAPPSP